MAVNASRMDEEQKEVSKKETIFRLFGYLNRAFDDRCGFPGDVFSLPGRDEGKDGGDGFRVQPGTGDHTSAAL